jgi:esterase/lipase
VISFAATDGGQLTGTLHGTGATAVVLSNMGDNDPAPWDAFAARLAERGYLVLTYTFRYPTNTAAFDTAMANHTVDDLRGAIAQVRAAGATRLALVGASLGGMATAKAAAVEKPAAIVVLSAPVDLTEFAFHVRPSELRSAVPKLFIGSADDGTVPFAETQRMFTLAADPKELHPYSGSAHGLRLFDGEHANDLTQRLLAFITSRAPATAR